MENRKSFECFICTMPVPSGNCLSLSAKGKDGPAGKSNLQLLTTCLDRNVWLLENVSIQSAENKHNDDRRICMPCSRTIVKCEKNILELKNRMSVSSAAFKQFVRKEEQGTVTEDDISPLPIPISAIEAGDQKASNQDNPRPMLPPVKNVTAKQIKMPKTPVKKKIKTALKTLRNKGTVYNTVRDEIHKEVVIFAKKSSLSNQTEGLDVPEDKVIIEELKKWAPLTMSAMRGMFLKNCREYNFSPAIRIAIGVAGYKQNRNCNRLQKSIGLKLFKGQSTLETYGAFQKMGLCTSYKTVLNLLDKKRKDFDKPLLEWKTRTEEIIKKKFLKRKQCERMEHSDMKLPRMVENEEELMDVDQNSMNFSDLNLACSSSDEDKAQEPLATCFTGGSLLRKKKTLVGKEGLQLEDLYYGITLCFDNINKHVKRAEYSSHDKNAMLNMVSAYATFNRVGIPWENLMEDGKNIKCSDLPMSTWVLSEEEALIIQAEHKAEICRILTRYLEVFKTLKKRVPEFSEHSYSEQAKQPSKYVNLGVINQDEMYTQGILKILESFHKYIPEKPDGTKVHVGVWGDGLSTIGVKNAQAHFDSNCDDPKKSHKYLIPLNGAWHKCNTLLQDDVKIFWKETGLTFSDGTLPNFKSRFGHTQANLTVKHAFNETMTLFNFTAKSYIIAYAIKFLKFATHDPEDIPQSYKEMCEDDLYAVLDETANAILKFEWHDIMRSQKQTLYCICKKKYDPAEAEEYVGCEYRECCHEMWYHHKCLTMEAEKKNSPYLPPCELVDTGKVSKKKSKPEPWVCSKDCKLALSDKKLLYTKSIVFAGLNHMTFHRINRSMDGDRNPAYHKMHMPQFFKMGHPKYFKIYHMMLAYLHGYGPKNIINDIKRNFGISWTGGDGKNLSPDLVNEFLNKFIKQSICFMMGNYNENSILRRSQCSNFVDEIDNEFNSTLEYESAHGKTKHFDKAMKDLKAAVGVILENELLHNKGSRCHSGFEGFQYDIPYIEDIVAMEEELKKLSSSEDMVEEFITEKRVLESLSDTDSDEEFDWQPDPKSGI